MSFQDEIFGKTSYEKRFVSDKLNAAIDDEASTTPAWFRQLARQGTMDVAGVNPGLIREQKANTGAILDSALRSSARLGTDPTQAAKDWTDYQMGNLTKLINQASGADSAAAKMMKARLGYAGRPGGTFDTVLRTREFADRYAPIGASIINNGASQSALNRGQDSSAIATLMGLAGMLPGIYDSQADAYMRPARAASGVASTSAGILQALADAARGNFAGFEAVSKAGLLDYAKAANGMLSDTLGLAGQAGDVVGKFAGGGGGGGGAGASAAGGGGLGGIMGKLSLAGVN